MAVNTIEKESHPATEHLQEIRQQDVGYFSVKNKITKFILGGGTIIIF